MERNNLYIKLKKGTLAIFAALILSSCNVNDDDFFVLPDRGGMDANIWNTEGAVNMHLNKTYDLIIPKFPYQTIPDRLDIHHVSDQRSFSSNGGWGARPSGITGAALIHDEISYVGNCCSLNYLDNRYTDIGRLNNPIKYLPESSIRESSKRALLGQYYAMRATV